jgi:hypothetical protein
MSELDRFTVVSSMISLSILRMKKSMLNI